MSRLWLGALLPLLLVPTGCAATSGPEAQTSVTRFYDAYRDQHGAVACALLTPGARKDVVGATRTSCARGVLRERLPRVGSVRRTEVFGDQAQVRMGGDTAFVARIGQRWQVRAVGCARRQDAPYECEVEDGG